MVIAAFSFVYGNPLRIINGYDSFGNTCGTNRNKPMGNLALTGVDTSDKPYLLFYDIKDIKRSLKICVKECPTKTLNTVQDIYSLHTKGIDLCRYDFNYNELSKLNEASTRSFGPCPVLPVYERYVKYKTFTKNCNFSCFFIALFFFMA